MLRTERLTIEPSRSQHADAIEEAIRASLPDLQQWMGWAVDWDPDASRSYMREGDDNDIRFTIVKDGVPVGSVGILVPKPVQRSAEIGYWIRSDLCGLGFTTEAVAAASTWAFEVRGLHRLELRAGASNIASNRIAEKLGFSHRGLLREAGWAAQGFYDCNCWELLETDPRPF